MATAFQTRASMTGSVFSAAGAARQQAAPPDIEFSLEASKAKVAKALLEGAPASSAALARFLAGALFDRLLRTLLLMFAARFQRGALARCVERARQQHLEGYHAALISGRMAELEREEAAQRASLAQPWAELLLRHSSFRRPQRDRQFFEAVFSALEGGLLEALGRLGHDAEVSTELGALFRGPFNAAARRHRPPRSVDTLGVEQIWALKHEGGDRALRGKLIASLAEKASTLSVSVAALSNTPLVASAITSPIVARGALADPKRRDELLHLPHAARRRGANSGPGGAGVGAGAQGSMGGGRLGWEAAQQGRTALQVSPRREGGASGAPRAAVAAVGSGGAQAARTPGGGTPAAPRPTAALAAPGAAPGAAVVASGRALQAVAAALPEAAGLPLDEGLAYLILLTRHVQYGPSMGLTA
ncbi:hypothetical protein Rsub_07380 [Raphidocelis subcapitata]|uniref:Uncharacterized protein n=1 Tax=Raphidocelis subcapitata TaxID=307507 RepID=A0A2V0P448_9CHLO|nr:hypothetical protein Rsub_07380 [Raphidocelis subcapitata]|eukprot:GBF94644.1 hypothetical protein Rsub_07380 [Raphidocelis subcapitata]